MLGGAIWLESEVGIGSNFEFTIKAAAVPNSLRPEERRPAAGNGVRGERERLVVPWSETATMATRTTMKPCR